MTSENIVTAELKFEKTEAPNPDDICLYVIYKENDTLINANIPHLTGMTTTFQLYEPTKDYHAVMYVWDKNMRPLMDVQVIK